MSITLVQKNKSKGILTWYARVPDSKGIHFYSLGTSNKTEAKSVLVDKIRDGVFDEKDDKSTITLGEAAVGYEKYCRGKGVKETSIEMFMISINMLKPLFGYKVVDITNKDISDTFMLAAEGINPTTYKNRKTVISMFYKYIVDVLEVIQVNPIPKAIQKRKAVKPERHFWTMEQVERIISAAITPQHRLLYSFMAFAGLRKSEAVAMTPDKIFDGEIHVKGKGDKFATIPVCPRLQREIDRCPKPWNLVFNEHTLVNTVKKALPEGFPGKAHAHRFRHSFGSNLIRAGVNIKTVQKLMRHENITITLDIYGHILDTDTKEAMEKVFK